VVLLKPSRLHTLDMDQHQRLVAAIGTRFDKFSRNIQNLVPWNVVCWNRLQRTGRGDLFHVAVAVQQSSGGYQDNSYVRVSGLIGSQLSRRLTP
jgi:hypothetical protein